MIKEVEVQNIRRAEGLATTKWYHLDLNPFL